MAGQLTLTGIDSIVMHNETKASSSVQDLVQIEFSADARVVERLKTR